MRPNLVRSRRLPDGTDARERGELLGHIRLAQPVEGRCSLVKEGRVDALDVRRVLGRQVVVALQQRPALQDVLWRDPAFRAPTLREETT